MKNNIRDNNGHTTRIHRESPRTQWMGKQDKLWIEMGTKVQYKRVKHTFSNDNDDKIYGNELVKPIYLMAFLISLARVTAGLFLFCLWHVCVFFRIILSLSAIDTNIHSVVNLVPKKHRKAQKKAIFKIKKPKKTPFFPNLTKNIEHNLQSLAMPFASQCQ